MEAATAWLKAVHIVTLLAWAAGLFYLPGLLALHPGTEDRDAFFRLRRISRILYLVVVSPAAILAVLSGSALILVAGAHGGWLVLKLGVVGLMAAFHVFCGHLLAGMRERPVRWNPAALASLTAVPALLVPLTFYLVLAKPL